MSTLIIHPEDPTTDFLKPVYAPIKNKTIITSGVSKSKLRELNITNKSTHQKSAKKSAKEG